MVKRDARLPAGAVGPAVAVTTKAGTHIFAARDRLWISADVSASQPRAVTDVRAGDLVAFLGRVLAVQRVTRGSIPVAERPTPEADPGAPSSSVEA